MSINFYYYFSVVTYVFLCVESWRLQHALAVQSWGQLVTLLSSTGLSSRPYWRWGRTLSVRPLHPHGFRGRAALARVCRPDVGGHVFWWGQDEPIHIVSVTNAKLSRFQQKLVRSQNHTDSSLAEISTWSFNLDWCMKIWLILLRFHGVQWTQNFHFHLLQCYCINQLSFENYLNVGIFKKMCILFHQSSLVSLIDTKTKLHCKILITDRNTNMFYLLFLFLFCPLSVMSLMLQEQYECARQSHPQLKPGAAAARGRGGQAVTPTPCSAAAR